jgi:hypothetical protein
MRRKRQNRATSRPRSFQKPSFFSRKMAGPTRLELATSCVTDRRATKNNPPVSNVTAEIKQLSRDLSMWLAVRNCAHRSVGWAQKLAQSRWYSYPRVANQSGNRGCTKKERERPARRAGPNPESFGELRCLTHSTQIGRWIDFSSRTVYGTMARP